MSGVVAVPPPPKKDGKQNDSLPKALAQKSRNYLPDECFIETPCTRSCDDGFKLLLPNPSGHDCYGATLQVHPCNQKPCAVDCEWGSWSEWSPCLAKSYSRRRKRQIGDAYRALPPSPSRSQVNTSSFLSFFLADTAFLSFTFTYLNVSALSLHSNYFNIFVSAHEKAKNVTHFKQ